MLRMVGAGWRSSWKGILSWVEWEVDSVGFSGEVQRVDERGVCRFKEWCGLAEQKDSEKGR